jgi:hypothetical protein
MIQRHGVAVFEVPDYSGGNGLFSKPDMHFPGDLAPVPQIRDGLLKLPAPEHLSVERPEIRFHHVSSLEQELGGPE